MSADLDRRSFLKLVGGGIVVLVRLGPETAFAQGAYPKDINAYLQIGEDGRVTFFAGKIEMGQGITTSLAQMAADELGVSLDSVDMVLGDTDRCPWDAGTWGSLDHAQVRAGAAGGGGGGAIGADGARGGEAGRLEGPARRQQRDGLREG